MQLTESQRSKLKTRIKNILREAMFENGYYENMFPENMYPEAKKEKKEKEKKHHITNSKDKPYDGDGTDKKRNEVMKWLDSAQELHSILAYRLWPEKDEDEARSLFSKKYRGEDAEGNEYSFDDDDINKLFNMKDRYIDEIS